jgi:phage tail sheath gpL-like
VVDTEIRVGGGPDTASTAFGPGSPGHLAAIQVYNKNPGAVIDFGAPTAGATASTLNLTASGVPTSDTSVNFLIAGRSIDVLWFASETADTFKARAITYINARNNDVPVIASSGGTGVVTLTGKVLGNISLDIKVKAALNATVTGTEAITGGTLAALAGGTTDPDFTLITGAAAGTEYHYILLCLSNTDAVLTSASANAKRVRNIINNLNFGLNAKLQMFVVGSTASVASTKAGSVASNADVGEWIVAPNMLSLPCELGAREVAGRLAAVSIDPAANRIGEILDGLYPPLVIQAERVTTPTSEDALGNGVSIVSYNQSGDPFLIRAVTSYSVDSAGAADRRLLDTQNVDASYIVTRDIRDNLPKQFPNAKITKDAPSDSDPDPVEGVLEERDIKSWVVGRLRTWVTLGVLDRTKLETAITDGSLIVQVDPSDETQVDYVLPFKIVKGLAKHSVVAQRFN